MTPSNGAQHGAAEPLLARFAVVAETPGGAPHDLLVETAADASSADVVAALARRLGVPAEESVDVPAFSPRLGRPLLPGEPFAEAVRHGDRLVVAVNGDRPSAEVDGTPAKELVVVGGMHAAARGLLGGGDSFVGRDAGCSVVIDDPSISRVHLRVRAAEEGVSVADAGSTNGTTVEGRLVGPGEERVLADREVVRIGRTLLGVGDAASALPEPEAERARRGLVDFNRPMRVLRRFQPAAPRFPAPPEEAPRYGRVGLLASAPFALLGVALWAITGSVVMLLFVAIMPLMALMSLVEQRWGGRRGRRRQARAFRRRLAEVAAQLRAARDAEIAYRRRAAPAAAELLAAARGRREPLWERRRDDHDFLELRIGSADRPALETIELEPGGSGPLREEAERLFAAFETVPSVPVTVALAGVGALGLCGPRERVAALARQLVLQTATLHSPRDVVVAAALDDEEAGAWGWLKWLPHACDPAVSSEPAIGVGRANAREVVEGALRLKAEREAEAAARPGGDVRWGRFVVLVVDEQAAPERSLTADLLDGAARSGIGVLWLGRDRAGLPGECRAVVELDDRCARLVYREAPGVEDVLADGVDADLAEDWALALAPLRDVAAAAPGSGIPTRVGLLDLLGPDALEPSQLARRWRAAPPELAAAIGVADGGPFVVDLRADGPHALVAGITGAGKSELLRTLIASFAAAYPPTRLSFVLVDYKGGLAFKECVDLPHSIGFVTDLDEHLTQRALASLRAELRRRETILGEAGAVDLPEMERRDPEHAPPSLIIVIDEFAGLAEELPDFIEGLVDVARRGRSLGVHLILATQRPGGVVSQQIRANTNLRVALRVNETGESVDIIGTQDAARIPRRLAGRAFALTGHGDLTEFQTGYSGAPSAVVEDRSEPVVREFSLDGQHGRDAPRGGAGTVTDLQRLVRAAGEAAATLGLEPPPSPWLPPLPPVVPLADVSDPIGGRPVARVGLLDDPAGQLQRPFAVDLERDGSLLVFGTSGSGKTTLLRTLAVSLAERSSPDELHVYGLDFASRALATLESLPHCGCVIAADDEERVKRLLVQLRQTLEARKRRFEARGSFTPSGGEDARILVLLDGYGGFADAFFEARGGLLLDTFAGLVRDGRPLGVHFAITSERRGAVPNALAAIIPTKIVLRMAEADEFLALGVSPRAIRGAALPAGRGFVGGLELQCALVGDDPSTDGQLLALTAIADDLRARYGAARAPVVEVLPSRLPRARLPAPARAAEAVIGIDDTGLAPAAIDLSQRHFLVAGPYRSGRSTALRVIAESVCESRPSPGLHLLAPRSSALGQLAVWESVAIGAEEVEASAERLAAQLLERRASGAREPLVVVVVDDADELVDALAAPSLDTIVRLGRHHGMRVVAAAERQVAGGSFGGWLHELRKDKYGLLLEPDLDVDGGMLNVRLPRWSSPVFPAGRGFLVDRGSVLLIQVALPD